MKKVAKFTKVSYDQFSKDMHDCFDDCRKFTEDEIKDIYANIKLPTRATSGSAGYDFRSPIDFELAPESTIKIPTGIRCEMNQNYVLMVFTRSSIGFKYQMNLANNTAIVDADYYYADNEGHIFIKIVNNGFLPLKINQGDKFVQGILIKYGITFDDDSQATRKGGVGSTGK